jgi:hypothetical protein
MIADAAPKLQGVPLDFRICGAVVSRSCCPPHTAQGFGILKETGAPDSFPFLTPHPHSRTEEGISVRSARLIRQPADPDLPKSARYTADYKRC